MGKKSRIAEAYDRGVRAGMEIQAKLEAIRKKYTDEEYIALLEEMKEAIEKYGTDGGKKHT